MAGLTVLVLAVGGNVGQGILKALARSGRDCRVIGADIRADQMGLFTVDCAYVSPWASDDAFLPWLTETCIKESVSLILCGCEPILMVLSKHRAQIERETGSVCIVSNFDVMETGDDKLQTCRWLAANGFHHPKFADTRNREAVGVLLESTGYPLIGKPRRGGGSHGLYLVEDADDLEYLCRKQDYLLQEYVGTEEDEYTVGCFVDSKGALATSCVMRRDLLDGTTYRAVLGEFPDVRAEAERIVAALQPLGPCNVQLRMTDAGPVCFEINPRFSGTAPIRAYYGYNEVDAVIGHFVLGEAVALPRVTEGVALRYWNELYVEPGTVNALSMAGRLEEARGQGAEIEWFPEKRPGPR